MTKIFIVGGTGYIGENLVRDLVKNGIKSVAEDKLEITVQGTNPVLCNQFRALGCRVIQTHDRSAIGDACANQDIVVNCAGIAKTFDDPARFNEANVELVDSLVGACIKQNVKLIHISSPSVYVDKNYNHHENIREEKEGQTLPSPVSDYSRTKLEADKLIKKGWEKGLKAIILRPHLVYGPGDKKILYGLIKAHTDGLLPLFENGYVKVDMTYIGNCIHAIKLAITSNNYNPGQIYNITDGEPIAVKDLIDNLFVNQLGIPKQNINMYKMPRGSFTTLGGIFSLGESCGKVMQKLGSDPKLEKTKFWLSHFACTATHNLDNAKMHLGYKPLYRGNEGRKFFADWYKANYKIPMYSRSVGKRVAIVGGVTAIASLAVITLGLFGKSYIRNSTNSNLFANLKFKR